MRRILALALVAFALLAIPTWQQVAEAQTPAPKIERFPVRWVEAPDPLGLDDFKEPAEPFAEERARALQGPPFEIGPPAWGLYVIDAAKGGNPRSVLETKRQLHGIEWVGSNLKTNFETRFSGYSSVLQRPRTLSWEGTYDVDLARGRATAIFDIAPTDYGLLFEDPLCTVNRTLCFEVTAVPETKLLLTTASRGASMQHTPYLVDADRRARVLDGFPSAPNLTPSPDGSLLYSYLGTGDLTLVPTSDGDAVIVRGVTNYAIQQPLFPAGRAVFAVRRAGSPCCFDDFYTYDMTTGALQHIGAAELDSQPTELTWDTPDSVTNHTQRLNLVTGTVTLLEDEPRPNEEERRLAPPSPVTGPQSTLLGRYKLSTADVSLLPAVPQGDCRLLPRQVVMTDTVTGTETTLFECPTGGPAIAQWLDGETILISATTRTCCHGSGYRYLLYKYITGAMFELNQTNSRENAAYVSPDGTRILIKTERLVVYNLNAEVVRDYDPAPEGWQFLEASWSPDSASIAFILEPKNWPHGL